MSNPKLNRKQSCSLKSVLCLFYFILFSVSLSVDAEETDHIAYLDYTSTSNLIAVGYVDATLEIRYFDTDQILASFPNPLSDFTDDFTIYDLAFSPDGMYLAVSFGGYADAGILQIINTITLHVQQTITAGSFIGALAWSNDSQHIAAKVSIGLGNPTLSEIRVWEVDTGIEHSHVVVGAQGVTVGLDWHNNHLVSIDRTGVVVVRDTNTWQQIGSNIVTNHILTDVIWSADGTRIIAVDTERTIYVWDSATGVLFNTYSTKAQFGSYRLDINTNNEVVANGTNTITTIHLDDNVIDFIPVTTFANHVIWLNNGTIAYSQGTEINIQTMDNILPTSTQTNRKPTPPIRADIYRAG
jgi:WD40 repeat protein